MHPAVQATTRTPGPSTVDPVVNECRKPMSPVASADRTSDSGTPLPRLTRSSNGLFASSVGCWLVVDIYAYRYLRIEAGCAALNVRYQGTLDTARRWQRRPRRRWWSNRLRLAGRSRWPKSRTRGDARGRRTSPSGRIRATMPFGRNANAALERHERRKNHAQQAKFQRRVGDRRRVLADVQPLLPGVVGAMQEHVTVTARVAHDCKHDEARCARQPAGRLAGGRRLSPGAKRIRYRPKTQPNIIIASQGTSGYLMIIESVP